MKIKKYMIAAIAAGVLTSSVPVAHAGNYRELISSWCTKKTTLIVGVAAVAGYYLWKQWKTRSLKTKIDGLIDTYLQDINDNNPAMPFRSDLDKDKEVVQRLVWQTIEQALNHFKNKKMLKTVTSYASGNLGIEYLIIQALELAGFDNIRSINLVDIMYQETLSFDGLTDHIFEDDYSNKIAETRRSVGIPFFDEAQRNQAMNDLLKLFKEKFWRVDMKGIKHRKNLNAFQSIGMHTAALHEVPHLQNQRTDLLLLINFQDRSFNSESFNKYIRSCQARYPGSDAYDFNDISKLNTAEHALIVEHQGIDLKFPRFFAMPQTLKKLIKKSAIR